MTKNKHAVTSFLAVCVLVAISDSVNSQGSDIPPQHLDEEVQVLSVTAQGTGLRYHFRNFSVWVPYGWNVQQFRFTPDVLFRSPPMMVKGHRRSKFVRVSFLPTHHPFVGGKTPQEFVNQFKKDVIFEDQVLSQQRTMLADIPAEEILTVDASAKSSVPFKRHWVIGLIKGAIVIVEFAAPEPVFKEASADFEQIRSSFELKLQSRPTPNRLWPFPGAALIAASVLVLLLTWSLWRRRAAFSNR